MNLRIDTDRLMGELNALARISSYPSPAVTRIVFSEEDLKAREYLRGLYERAGLEVRVDAIGNTFARWIGSDPKLPGVGTGSHTDAIPNAGMYDGTVGVLGGLEAIRALKAAGFRPRRSIELVMFTSEEPTRFGIGCTGSRGMANPNVLKVLKDKEDGATYDEVRKRAGFTGELSEIALAKGYYHAFVELHIEQGPKLEKAKVPIGIVTAIAAPATIEVVIEGEGGHAGGVLMAERKDAFGCAAEVALVLERMAREASVDTVGTCGLIKIEPGAVNSIPYRATLTLDIRDIDNVRRDKLIAELTAQSMRIAERRGVKIAFKTLNADEPATCSEMVVDAIGKACEETGTKHLKFVSRAYHDSLFMARIAPIGMIFIPCLGGVSHRPDEYASAEDIAKGAEILARTMGKLAE